MKKIIKLLSMILFIVITIIFATANSYAAEFMPGSMNSINNHVIGVYFAPEEIKIYATPEENSELIEIIRWNAHGVEAVSQDLSSKETFLAFVPNKKYALMSVTSENENNDWIEVIYNKKTEDKGWVKNPTFDRFKTWLEFMRIYGKQNRLYLLSDIPEKYKSMHTESDESSQLINNNFISIQEIELVYISGNWMLVREIDYNKTAQIGWIRWRNNDGNIFIFPKLDSN
ncbi:MAG: hypothetical protein PHC34_10290 [Candidatus Gastranaerophilales bacterium]|nr:hypothetical protein [Candidatus Gastranaerophilales bacterium]